MATSVITAFNEFMKNKVNLDSDETDLARRSRDWLVDRIHEFPSKDATFPSLYSDIDISFGSFERKTKKRPLDDIDMMIGLNAQTATYITAWDGTVYLETSNQNSPLYNLRHDGSSRINSKRVINKFVSLLTEISQYEKAEISRRGEAAILNLKSYPWTFDIVPCFQTSIDNDGKKFYLIPNGDGNWQKTDPSIDRSRVQKITRERGTKVLSVIRLIKYWNQRPTMPSMPSYLLENMILDYYENHNCTDYCDLEFRDLVKYVGNAIHSPVHDPKGIQGDLNKVDLWDRISIALRCLSDHRKSVEAINFETENEIRKSINKWTEILGPEFPAYG